MEVLKVVAEGLTASFRYPHFMQGVQPTFEMPPPATLYGHVCSVLGEWFDPHGVRFAIHFAYDARFDDIEHTHMVEASSGTLPGTRLPKVLEGAVNPFVRSQLFRPRLTLYLNRPDWADRFSSPRYAVGLGRSQDLFCYTRVETLRLERAPGAYFEHTLAPYSFARRVPAGVVVLMPRLLDYAQRRQATFGRYLVLHPRVHTRDFLRFAGEEAPQYWVDPSSPVANGDHLGLAFHSWVGDDESTLRLA